MTKKRSRAAREALDTGPRERYQHGDETLVEATEDAGRSRVVILTQDALDRYYQRRQLDRDEDENKRLYDAGVRLRQDFHRAGLTANVISRYSDLVSGGAVQGFLSVREENYRRWRDAIQAIGPIASNEVIEVCCIGGAVGKGGPLEIFRRGMKVLADYYGY